MKIIYNKILPFTGFKAINLFGILFVRKNAYISEYDINHEQIHSAQMKEMLYIFFYIWYLVEYLIKVFKYKSTDKAYHYLSFELEAYNNMHDKNYLKNRIKFKWVKYY